MSKIVGQPSFGRAHTLAWSGEVALSIEPRSIFGHIPRRQRLYSRARASFQRTPTSAERVL